MRASNPSHRLTQLQRDKGNEAACADEEDMCGVMYSPHNNQFTPEVMNDEEQRDILEQIPSILAAATPY
jgi:uncharacterized protein YkuJ